MSKPKIERPLFELHAFYMLFSDNMGENYKGKYSEYYREKEISKQTSSSQLTKFFAD